MADETGKLTLEEAQKLLALDAQRVELKKQYLKLSTEARQALREQAAAGSDLEGYFKGVEDTLKRSLEHLQTQAEELQTAATRAKERYDMEAAGSRLKMERFQAYRDARMRADDGELRSLERKLQLGEKINAEELKNARNKKKVNDLIRSSAGNAKQLGASMANNFKITTKTQISTEKLAGNFVNILGVIARGPAAMGAMFGALSVGMLVKFIDNVVNLAVDLANMENEFRKATGASLEMAQSITTAYEATRFYGVSAAEASQASQALYKTFTDFTMIGADVRREHQRTAGILGELGVSYDSYASSVQTATKGLGVTAGAADDMMLSLTAHAMDLEVPVEQLMGQFAAISPQLTKLGANGEKAFKDLARVQKITGFEMQQLLNLTNKFDTFESAAEMTGKLNAALGGNFVNAMDMMMETDPAKRFESIRDAIESTGLTFDTMSYYQKLFYTESLGLKDVSQLAAMMSGDMKSLDSNIGKTSADYKKMAERARAVQSIQESLQNLLVEMTPILKPLIAGIRDIVLDLAGWAKENKELVQGIGKGIAVFGTLITLFMAAKPILLFVALVFKGIAAAIFAIAGPVGVAVALIAGLVFAFTDLKDILTFDIGSDLTNIWPDMSKGLMGFSHSAEEAAEGTGDLTTAMVKVAPPTQEIMDTGVLAAETVAAPTLANTTTLNNYPQANTPQQVEVKAGQTNVYIGETELRTIAREEVPGAVGALTLDAYI
jgi:hypothetical protein